MASNRVPPAGATSATTSSAGIVQLTDSTSSTSTTTAATPNAVKSAFDLANGAIAKTLTTTTGDIIYASSANTPARLGIGSASQVLTVSGGIPSWVTLSATYDGVKAYSSVGQAIANTTHTTINFGGEDFKTNSSYHSNSTNNSRITIPSTGYYRIHAQVTLPSSGDNQVLTLLKNGGEIQRTYNYATPYTGSTGQIHGTWYLTANDYIQLNCWHNFGSSRTTYDGQFFTFIEVQRLGA